MSNWQEEWGKILNGDIEEELKIAMDFILNKELWEEYLQDRKNYYHDKNIPLELTFSESFIKELEEE